MSEATTLPSFVRGDLSEGTKLLSRFNIQGTKETEVFYSLVKMGVDKIAYEEALNVTGLANNEPLFLSVLKKFEECQIAVIRHGRDINDRSKSYIRLCDEGSLAFFCEYITEILYMVKVTNSENFTFGSELHKKGIEIPDEHTVPYNINMIQGFYDMSIEALEDTLAVISIPLQNDVFYFTPASAPFVCDLCISKLQALLQKKNLVHVFAKNMDTTLAEMKQKIDTTDFIEWNTIADTFYPKLDSLATSQDFKNYPESITLLALLYHLLKSKISELETRHKFSEHFTEFTQSVVKRLKSIPDGVLETQLKTIMWEIADSMNIEDADQCIQKFLEEMIMMPDDINSSTTTPIIKMDQFYIHRDLLKQVISDRYFALKDKLQEYYKNLLRRYLTKSLSPKEIVFFDDEVFEASIHQKVMQIDELYYKILKNPVVLAHAIIEKSNDNQNLAAEDVPKEIDFLGQKSNSRRLSLFFDLHTQRLLKWSDILNINVPKLGDQAYKSLGFFSKILLIFTGRYKNLNARLRRISTVKNSFENTQKKKSLAEHTKRLQPSGVAVKNGTSNSEQKEASGKK